MHAHYPQQEILNGSLRVQVSFSADLHNRLVIARADIYRQVRDSRWAIVVPGIEAPLSVSICARIPGMSSPAWRAPVVLSREDRVQRVQEKHDRFV